MPTSPLIAMNSFQLLMRRWQQLHPYNAMDILEIFQPADSFKLQRAAEIELEARGMAHVEVERNGASFRYLDQPASVEVETLPAVTDPLWPTNELQEWATLELNRAFPESSPFPLRLFVLPCGDRHFVGQTYAHWIADGVTGNDLFHGIVHRYLSQPLPAGHVALRGEVSPSPRQAFGHLLNLPQAIESILYKICDLWENKRSYLPAWPLEKKLAVDARFLMIEDDLLARLKQFSRSEEVTINDVLLAAQIEALAAATPLRHREIWKTDLGLSSMIDLRPLSLQKLAGVAGLYLSYFNVRLWGEMPSFRNLVQRIHGQTQRVKKRRLYLSCSYEYPLMNFLWPLIPRKVRPWFFAKTMPLSGGSSNLRVPDSWYSGPIEPLVGRYWRAVPLGFMSPLGLGITSNRGRITIELSTIRSGYSAEQIQMFQNTFLSRLSRL